MHKKSTLLFVSIFFLLFIGLNTPSYACHRGFEHGNSGPCESDANVATFDVMFYGAVSGESVDPWRENNGGQKRISLGQFSGDIGELDLSFFVPSFPPAPFTGDRGANCFGFMSDDIVQLHPQAAIQRGRGGRADSTFWFDGCTDEGRDPELTGECKEDVAYVLKMFGEFFDRDDWPPAESTSMTMFDWTIEREGEADKNRSCLGGGGLAAGEVFEVVIEVTRTQ